MDARVQLEDGRWVDAARLAASGFQVAYGRIWPAQMPPLGIEYQCLLAPPKGTAKLDFARRIIIGHWPNFEFNRWAEEQLWALCNHSIIAFVGCTDSGKTEVVSRWVLINWWAAPLDTAILATSTTLSDARKKIWGAIQVAHRDAHWPEGMRSIGKVIGQPTNAVMLTTGSDGVRGTEKEAISLIPAGNENADKAIKSIQGVKNKRVILALDEMQHLAEALSGSALEQLDNIPSLQIVAFGNLTSPEDPLGRFAKPALPNGYEDTGPEMLRWPIDVIRRPGICIRFDAEKSPNFDFHVPGQPDRFPYLPKVDDVERAKAEIASGRGDVADYYRTKKAYIAPKGTEDSRWPKVLIRSKGGLNPPLWKGNFVMGAGADPAYSTGGDRFMFKTFGYGLALMEGKDAEGRPVMLEKHVIGFLEEFALQFQGEAGEDRNFSMIRQCKELLAARNIASANFGIDCTGGFGIGSIAAEVIGADIIQVQFGGKASDKRVSVSDPRPCHEEYGNHSSELWCVGADFLRHSQICGLSETQANELNLRRVRRGAGNKLFVEPKADMKRRTGGISPDCADAGSICVEVARSRFGAIAGGDALEVQMQSLRDRNAKAQSVQPRRLRGFAGISSRSYGRRW